ncbi:hypothetical protein EV291_13312 [Rhizobium sp. BK068]|nr:hypothetical protein EV291_13312 [Rhizobium sp. BK068]
MQLVRFCEAGRRPGPEMEKKAVDFADRVLVGKAVCHGDEIGKSILLHRVEQIEIGRIPKLYAPPELISTGRLQVVEGSAAPVVGHSDRRDNAQLHDTLQGLSAIPTKGAALVERMERIHHRACAFDRKAACGAALAEACQEVGFGKAC